MILGLGWLAGFRIIPDKVCFSECAILSRIRGFSADTEIYIRSKSISCEYGILYSQMSEGRRDQLMGYSSRKIERQEKGSDRSGF